MVFPVNTSSPVQMISMRMVLLLSWNKLLVKGRPI
jgi:hypothetical protein